MCELLMGCIKLNPWQVEEDSLEIPLLQEELARDEVTAHHHEPAQGQHDESLGARLDSCSCECER